METRGLSQVQRGPVAGADIQRLAAFGARICTSSSGNSTRMIAFSCSARPANCELMVAGRIPWATSPYRSTMSDNLFSAITRDIREIE